MMVQFPLVIQVDTVVEAQCAVRVGGAGCDSGHVIAIIHDYP